MRFPIISILVLLTLGGCAIVPETIDVAENETLVDYEKSKQTDVVGEKARWGGKIVSVENKKEVSEIEIVYFPESKSGRPKTGEASAGRFKAVVAGFVDPLVFEEGRLITVVGDVGETTTGIIGEQEYAYPVLNAVGYHMWKDIKEVRVDTFALAPFGYYSHFNHSFFNPWYHPWHYRNHSQRWRITNYNGHEQGTRVDRRNRNNNVGSSSNSGSNERRSRGQQSARISTPTTYSKPNSVQQEK